MKNQIFIPNIFQSEAQKSIEDSILKGENIALVVMPTGTGKTYLAAQWFRLKLEKNPNARLLYVCHSQDILSQANDKEFENCLSEFDIPRGYYNKSEKNIGQITFATVQTLRENLNKLPSDYFDYIIVDEAHHYRAVSFEKTIKHFSPKVLLGLTATPNRMDGKSLSDVFGRAIYSASIRDGIKSGLLSKIKYYYVDNDIDFSKIKHSNNGRYREIDLNKNLCVKEYDDAIIKEYEETVKGKHNRKKTICFCATVEHAYRMERLFNDNGIKAATLTGKRITETGKEVTVHDGRRKQIINMFKDGNYDIIFVRDLFNEGVDIPDADCIMMLRPTESSRIFTQQIGRGLRISNGKDYLLVLDFTGNCYKCDINYEVLNDIFETNIEKDVRDRISSDNPSEIIIQNIGCEVRLSKRKIDVIKDSYDRAITAEKLIENYFNVKNKLGRQPSSKDFEKNKNSITLYSLSSYRYLFGSWNNFLRSIDEKYIDRWHKATEKELIDNYLELKKELNKVPTTIDMDIHGRFNHQTYARRFGSWNKFILSMEGKIDRIKITNEELIENYLDVKKELNKVPTFRELKMYGRFNHQTYTERFGSWNKFLLSMGEEEEGYRQGSVGAKEELIKNYWDLKNKYPNLKYKMVTKENGSRFHRVAYAKNFGGWRKFLDFMNHKFWLDKCNKEECKNNVTIVSDYVPKNPLPDSIFETGGKKNHINTKTLSGHRYGGSVNKDSIRHNIIDKIDDDDIVLILESPELGALKEIEKQGKNPKKIIIPNHLEFGAVATALKMYDTNLNIELVNTPALQYIVDHPEEHFNFLWLDYCGGFSYYTRDLDAIFKREIRDMKLVLTYNIFDPKKQDSSYYFTNVIGYVLKKLRGKNEILLMEDISQRYKKTMFSVGFDIKKSI